MLSWHHMQYLLALNIVDMLFHLSFHFFSIHFAGIDDPELPLINAGRMAVRIVFKGVLSVKGNNHHKQNGDVWLRAFTKSLVNRSNFVVSSAEGMCLICIILRFLESTPNSRWCQYESLGGLGEKALLASKFKFAIHFINFIY